MNGSAKPGEQVAAYADLARRSPILRAVNYHNTPRTKAAAFEREIERFAREYSPVSEDDLDGFLESGRWEKSKPGLIIAVYEGYRNGFDVFMPILDRYGMTGWFFVITDFVKTPPGRQFEFASTHDIDMETREYESDGRYAMTWDELRQLRQRHVVGSHTRTHVSLAKLDEPARRYEVLGAQDDIRRNLGRPARTFVSLGGPAYGDDPATDRLVLEAGYQFVVSNLRIQRLRGWSTE